MSAASIDPRERALPDDLRELGAQLAADAAFLAGRFPPGKLRPVAQPLRQQAQPARQPAKSGHWSTAGRRRYVAVAAALLLLLGGGIGARALFHHVAAPSVGPDSMHTARSAPDSTAPVPDPLDAAFDMAQVAIPAESALPHDEAAPRLADDGELVDRVRNLRGQGFRDQGFRGDVDFHRLSPVEQEAVLDLLDPASTDDTALISI